MDLYSAPLWEALRYGSHSCYTANSPYPPLILLRMGLLFEVVMKVFVTTAPSQVIVCMMYFSFCLYCFIVILFMQINYYYYYCCVCASRRGFSRRECMSFKLVSSCKVKPKGKDAVVLWMELISLSQAIESIGGYTTESVTHGQCDARPTVTFPASEHHRSLSGTNLYCLVNRGRCVGTTCPRSFVKRSSRVFVCFSIIFSLCMCTIKLTISQFWPHIIKPRLILIYFITEKCGSNLIYMKFS